MNQDWDEFESEFGIGSMLLYICWGSFLGGMVMKYPLEERLRIGFSHTARFNADKMSVK